jgi:hypothetical protein
MVNCAGLLYPGCWQSMLQGACKLHHAVASCGRCSTAGPLEALIREAEAQLAGVRAECGRLQRVWTARQTALAALQARCVHFQGGVSVRLLTPKVLRTQHLTPDTAAWLPDSCVVYIPVF